MLRKIMIALMATGLTWAATAQTTVDLKVHYKFDGSLTDEYTNSTAVAQNGSAQFGCGADGTALKLSGDPGEGVLIFGQEINNLFRIADFTISFYFKSTDFIHARDIISKRLQCDADSMFAIRYVPNSSTISAELSEKLNKSASLQHKLDASDCWHHIAVVRDHTRTLLYVDGQYAGQNSIATVINITNDAPLAIGASPCLATTDDPLKGYLDDLRIYSRALTNAEIIGLYNSPDQIVNRDTIIYIGATVPVTSTNTCAFNFLWDPITDISSPYTTTTTITPSQAGDFTYTLMYDDDECIAYDTLRIKVIDPSTLDCEKVYLPNAFTPNGDPNNEKFGISNPIVVQELVSFEIYDRWGNRVFRGTDALDTWDGSYNGSPVNSGIFLYQLRWRCNGQEYTQNGPVTLIR